ncbi:MAG: hypothetical protein ACOYMA_17785 [Bacteroidia bacterium]
MINSGALDSYDKSQITSDIENRCFMCRVKLTNETSSQEHIFPKWILAKYNMFNQALTLPNKTFIPYQKWKVQCCTKCNNNRMSDIENQIKKSVSEGIESVKFLDEELIVWWLLKLYYAKIYKEAQLKKDVSKPELGRMIEKELFEKYNIIFLYMRDLLNGFKFNDPKPFELFIFKTNDETTYDYIDDIISNTVYLRLDSIIFICCFNGFGIAQIQCQHLIDALNSLSHIHYYQAIELFSKITYFNRLYGKEVEHSYSISEDSVTINSKILKISEYEIFDFYKCNCLIKNLFELRGLITRADLETNNLVTIILKSNGETYTYQEIENGLY